MNRELLETLSTVNMSWQSFASCRGKNADLFFPDRGASTREAKRICGQCEVRIECRDYAISHNERFGIWGGMSERERRRFRKENVEYDFRRAS